MSPSMRTFQERLIRHLKGMLTAWDEWLREQKEETATTQKN